MNRRRFLGGLLTLLAAPFVPKVASSATGFFEPAVIGWKTIYGPAVLNGEWMCVLHPSVEHDLRTMAMRDKWRGAWRHARTIGIAHEATPQHILRVYDESLPKWEVGRCEGVRILTAKNQIMSSGVNHMLFDTPVEVHAGDQMEYKFVPH